VNQTITPGIFEGLNDSQKAAIRYSIALGLDIQTAFPNIAKDYENGKPLSKLVDDYNIDKIFGIKKSTAQKSITYALRGYRGDWDLFPNIVYGGLLNPEKYDRLAREHHKERGRKLGKEIGYKSGQKTFEAGTGVHGLNYEEKHKAGQKGIVEQGHLPWSDEEILKLEELSKIPYYQRLSQIHTQNITKEINRIFHNGNSIRSNRSIVKAFIRYRNRFDEFKKR